MCDGFLLRQVTLLKVKATDHGRPKSLSSSLILRIFINETSTLLPQSRYDSLALAHRRVSVVVAVSCASGFLLVLLVLALVCAFRRRRRRAQGNGPGKYNCRMEALKVLTVKDASTGGITTPETGGGPGGVAVVPGRGRGVAGGVRTDDGWMNRSGLQPMNGVNTGPDEDIYERIALKKLEMYELVGPHQQLADDQSTPSRRGTFEVRINNLLLTRLVAFFLAYLLTYLHAYLTGPTYCLPTKLPKLCPTYLLTKLLTYLPTRLLLYLFIYFLPCILSYLLIKFLVYLFACIFIYLFTLLLT